MFKINTKARNIFNHRLDGFNGFFFSPSNQCNPWLHFRICVFVVKDILNNVVGGRMNNKRFILIFFLLIILSSAVYAQVDTAWVRRFTGTLSDRANAITVDNSGNIYVTGYSNSSTSGDDYLTIKYFSNGSIAWTKIYNGPGNGDDEANAIAVDASGNIYVTGGSTGTSGSYDYLTIKYNALGDTCWTRRYNDPLSGDDEAYAIANDNSGYVYITGFARFSGHMEDYFTIKYNAVSGDTVWTRVYCGTSSGYTDIAKAMALDASGNIYITGVCYRSGSGNDYGTIKYYPNGDTAWVRNYNGPLSGGNDEADAITVDNSGNVYVTGFSNGSSSGEDYYTIKYSSSGSVLWQNRYVGAGGADADHGVAIKSGIQNSVYVTGYSTTLATGKDYATIKYNSLTGDTLWTRRYNGNNGADEARALAIDGYGNVFVTGYATNPNSDYFTIKYNSTGDTIFTRKYNGTSNSADQANAMAVDASGNVCVTGYSNGSVTGEDFLTIKYYTEDVSVTKIIQPTGNIDSTSTIIPQVQVKNYGNRTETFNIKWTNTTTGWSSTKQVTSLAPFDSTIVNFDPWTVGPRNTYAVKCSTELTSDMVRSNDKSIGTFTVQIRDYGVVSVVAPTGQLDSGATITPEAIIHNFGSVPGVSVPVICYIVGTGYSDTKYISLAPDGVADVLFTPFACNIPPGGPYTVRCTTCLTGDMISGNNVGSAQFSVLFRDFGVSAITSPSSFVDSGAIITPKAWIHNYGSTNEISVPVTFYINGSGLSYSNTQYVNLNAYSAIEQSFDALTANLPTGATYAMRCTTCLVGDHIESNNLATGGFTIIRTDVGVNEIIQPTGELDSTGFVIPRAKVKNYGTNQATFNVTLRIGSDYTSTKQVSALPPGNEDTVLFDAWVIGPRDTYPTICYTQLATDLFPGNDTAIGSVAIRVYDVGVSEIIAPSGSVDSTTTIYPQAKVKNYGNRIETFNVKMTIPIAGYNDTKQVSNLTPSDSAIVDFNTWVAGPRGTIAVKCSTELLTDIVRSNDTLRGTFMVRVRDYAATMITSPVSPVDSGTTITPKAWIHNYGNTSEVDSVVFYIVGTSYISVKYIALNAGDSIEQSFDPYAFNIPLGTYTTRCTTKLNGDMRDDNNLAFGSLTMRIKDYAVTSITSPFSTVDSTTTITPRAWIHNYGTYNGVNVPVIFYIVGTTYADTKQVSLNAGDSVEQAFNSFTAHLARGSYVMRCTTQLASDARVNNNLFIDSFRLLVYDVSVTEIIQPNGITDSAATIIPSARVKNNGTQDATFNTTFTIGAWSSTKEVSVLPPNEVDVVSFDTWPVAPRGNYVAKCSTKLTTDLVTSNDKLDGSFSIVARDYGISSVTAPTIVDSGTTIAPKAWIHNYGSTNEVGIPVTLYIAGTSITCTKYDTLASGDSIEQTFDWMMVDLSEGNYQLRCTTQLNGDVVVTNNLYTVPIRVVVQGWQTLSSLQLLSGRGVKDGGALTIIGDTIYALQGGNTKNFYAYDIAQDTWVSRCTIPYGLKPNGRINTKRVKAGGALAAYNDRVYAFKGNGTSEFWCYLPGQDSWFAMRSITELAAGMSKATKVKAGGALVTVADSIFAFKGGNTNEFWVFDIQNDTWYQRASLVTSGPTGIVKKIKGGAALAVKDSIIYAFVGGNTNYFYEYIIPQGIWTKLADVSFGYVKRKIKDGAALTETDGKIFALKGGAMWDFGYYDVGGNTWITKEVIPGLKVKAGAAMVSYDDRIYVLQGSNTNQFWRYTLSGSLPVVSTKSNTEKSIMTRNISPVLYSLVNVKPNPFINLTTISFNVAEPGKVSLKLFAIDGSVIKVLCDDYRQAGSYTIRLAGEDLAKGIYFLKYNYSLTNTEIKVIVR